MVLEELSRVWWYFIPAKWIMSISLSLSRDKKTPMSSRRCIYNSARSQFSSPKKKTLGQDRHEEVDRIQ